MPDAPEQLDSTPPDLQTGKVWGDMALQLVNLSLWVDAGLGLDKVCDRIDEIANCSKRFQTPEAQDYLHAMKAWLRTAAPKRHRKDQDHG